MPSSRFARRSRAARWLPLTLAALAVACSSSRNEGGIVCPALITLPPTLFLPSPGATGVPLAIGRLIVGFPDDGKFQLGDAGGTLTLPAATSLPSPFPSALPTDDTSFAEVPLPTLSAATTYTVTYVANPGSSPCGSGESGGTIGTFTTQQ